MTPCFQRLCKVASYLNFICTLLLIGSFYCTPAFQESLVGSSAVVVWKVFAYAMKNIFLWRVEFFYYEHEKDYLNDFVSPAQWSVVIRENIPDWSHLVGDYQ